MSTERTNIINDIKNAINKRKEILLKKIPLVLNQRARQSALFASLG